ncbi:MAG: hypothetical protein ACXW3Z_14480 [Limisphaerales bacterium]
MELPYGDNNTADSNLATEMPTLRGRSSTLVIHFDSMVARGTAAHVPACRMSVPKRILVIEALPEVLVPLLRTAGYLAVGATDLPGGLNLYAKVQRSIDVAILDEKVDHEGTLLLKLLADKPTLKIILMAKAQRNDLPSNVTILTKPVSPLQLKSAIG